VQAAVEALSESEGVNRDAVVVLLQAHTKMPKRDIEAVLDGLSTLRERFCVEEDPK